MSNIYDIFSETQMAPNSSVMFMLAIPCLDQDILSRGGIY